jgi:hypothetical protein
VKGQSAVHQVVRILFLADTHLGIDLPRRPRIERRRRGHDFFANYERALQAARDLAVDAVVHGDDSRRPPGPDVTVGHAVSRCPGLKAGLGGGVP